MLLKKLVAALVDHDGRERRERDRAFLKNGGLVLEKLVASCNGRPIPIRTFSYQQLILATNNFDRRLFQHRSRNSPVYKGSFEGRILTIKRYDTEGDYEKSMVLTNIGISAKMSAHKNVLKLVGCCLETSIPTLVFEYAQNEVLADRILISRRQGTPMVWQSRLKIARQIAHAIAYLNTAFSRPIIHRDINLQNIFLDQYDVPKLTGFSLSISIPEGETHVTDVVCGTIGHICPSYLSSGVITEKADVFSFSSMLLELLTGQPTFDLARLDNDKDVFLLDNIRNRAINEFVDPAILAEEGGAGVEQQLQAVLQLVHICCESNPEIRPTMVDVTKELRRIERSIT